MYYIRLLLISEMRLGVCDETHKVLDDSHEFWTEEIELETGIDDKRDSSGSNEWMTTIRRHARIRP
jgi:hypothetical protein